MKKLTPAIILLLIGTVAVAQNKPLTRKQIDSRADSIMAEGKALFRSEWASWYGTDIFLEKFKDKRPLTGGYLSYETSAGPKNIFFTKGDDPDVLATISFTTELNPQKFSIDSAKRKFDKNEKEIFTIRQAGLQRLRQDTTFKFYNNTDANIVPLIRNGKKRVYVLTAPKANGVVLYGNDYLIDFDKASQIAGVQRLHNSLLSAPTGSSTDSTQIIREFVHSHLPDKEPFMTATDICTTMLYQHLTTWKQTYVVSKDFVSIWDIPKQTLFMLTMDAWKKINEDQSSKQKKASPGN